MRYNSAAHWVASEEQSSVFLDPMFERIAHLLPPEVANGKLHARLSRRIAHYKYDDGDVFNTHTDGEWPGQSIGEETASLEEWPGLVSRLSMLLYLNDESDGVRGGATRLFGTVSSGGKSSPVDV